MAHGILLLNSGGLRNVWKRNCENNNSHKVMGQKRVSQDQGSCSQPSRAICHQRLADTERRDGALTPRLHFSIFSRKTAQKRLQSYCAQHVWFQLFTQKGKWDFPDSGRLPTATPKPPSPLLFPSEVLLKSIDSSGNGNLQPAIRIKGNSPNLWVARVFIEGGVSVTAPPAQDAWLRPSTVLTVCLAPAAGSDPAAIGLLPRPLLSALFLPHRLQECTSWGLWPKEWATAFKSFLS